VRKKGESICDLLHGAHDAWSGWVCVLMVGVAAGTVASVIDIGASWMVDLREGICPQAFWLNKEQCCWASNETFFDDIAGTKCQEVKPSSHYHDMKYAYFCPHFVRCFSASTSKKKVS
jgi:hypothetical protein